MRIMIVALAMLVGAPVQADCDPPGSFRLYRTLVDIPGRAHVATYDATDGEAYNWENCNIAAQRVMAQPGVIVRYWCEPVD